MASEGRRLVYQAGEGSALLAPVRDGASPRIHPINVGIVGGGLYAFVLRSAKGRDLTPMAGRRSTSPGGTQPPPDGAGDQGARWKRRWSTRT